MVGFTPRSCTAGTVIVHGAGENHADFFQELGRIVNIEIESTCSIDRALCLLDAWLEVSTETSRSLRGVLRNAVHQIRRERGVASHKPTWLEHVLASFEWIEPIPLEEAARSADVHPTHFARAFRHHVGMTPGAYRRRQRANAASERLLSSTISLSSVAHVTGFSDQSHFSNAFRVATGMSPGAYRSAFWR